MTQKNIQLSNEEAIELQKVRIRQEMQDEINAWAKKRFTMLGLIVGVLGFFGLSTVMHQTLQVVAKGPVEQELKELDSAVNEHLSRLDTARDRAIEVIAELAVLSRDVEEKGRLAQTAATAAAFKIAELESNISIVSRDADKIGEDFSGIRDGMSRVSADVFTLASGISKEEKRLRVEIDKTSRSLIAIEDLSTSVAEAYLSPQVEEALKRFKSEIYAINADYRSAIEHVNKIKTFNIVYYISRPEDEETAQAVVRALKSEGYRAAVWYAQGADKNAVIKEISGEFGGISDILETNERGVVSHPEHEDIASEIEELLSSRFKSAGHAPVKRPLQPAPIHLSHDKGKNTFSSDRVILIYSLGHEDS